jgi:CubicO group peptidase (beta-lactamase class C family)
MTPDTLWRIASISKSFCAMAIMQLVEKGKVDLHSPVNKYIDFKLGRKDKHIEVHHLLSHSSGIPELGATGVSIYKDVFVPMSSEQDFMTFVNNASREIAADPGKIFMYNNDMYTCLGLIARGMSPPPTLFVSAKSSLVGLVWGKVLSNQPNKRRTDDDNHDGDHEPRRPRRTTVSGQP